MRGRAIAALVALGLLGVVSAAGADVYVLRDGDRVTGKTVLKAVKTFTVQTSYGRLTIPREKIERILHDDGKEEVLNPPPEPPPSPPPPVHLIVVITGKMFWYAWDENASADPTLRLTASLDEETVVTYADAHTDPEGIRGATVNAFSFRPEDVAVRTAEGVRCPPPEARPGRVVLRVELPAERVGRRRLRLAYQVDEGSAADPAWRDVAEASLDVDLRANTPTFVEIQQDAGRMEFSRHRMKNTETFRIVTKTE